MKLAGYIPDLIDRLREKMGFIANIIVLPKNTTYNDLPDFVTNNTFDMIIGDITILAARREKVAFSDSIYDNSLRVLVRKKPVQSVHLFGFFKTFPLILWIIILGCMAWSAILLLFYEEFVRAGLRRKSCISRIGMSIWFSIGTFVGYGVDFHAKTAAGRCLTIGIYLVSIVLISAYQANLTANLTVAQSQYFISGIDDIKNGKITPNRVGIVVGSSIEDYFLREITDGSRTYYVLKSKQDIFEKLSSGAIDASIMDSGVAEYETNSVHCDLTMVGASFDHSAFGIIYQKKWLFEQILDVSILALRESGVFNDLKSKWFQPNHCTDMPMETTSNFSYESLTGIFIIFGGISLLSLLVFLCMRRAIIWQLLSCRRMLRIRKRKRDRAIIHNPAYAHHLPFIGQYNRV
ncbi:hypothetical protein I4U23_023370 [Adineta vaga]|nr:hypothetical protein I4U23_023370 [Adineta vaga]